MLRILKKVIGTALLAAFLVTGSMAALADDEVQNTQSPHILYQVFDHGAWEKEAQDKTSAANSPGLAVEGIKLWLTGVDGSISYRVYLHNGGWQGWVSDGAAAGGENTGNPIEAIQIKLGGYAGQVLDVWYRTTIADHDTLGWAKTGAPAGSVGEGRAITNFEACLTQIGLTGQDAGAISTDLPYGFYQKDGVNCYAQVPGGSYNGWLDSDGARYYVKDDVLQTGWQYIDGLKFYFDQQGKLVQDLDPIIGIQSSYLIKVNKELNCLTPYAKDGDNGYIIPVKAMLCSVGDDTPLGTFHTPEKYRWRLMVNDTYTQYATRIEAGKGFLIHSVCYDKPDIYSMQSVGYNGLGVVRSLGCVRLTAANAKWIYDNCSLGTTVEIYEDATSPGPFYKPAVEKIPDDQTWDPTDPLVSRDVKDQALAKQQQEQAASEQAKAQAAADQQAAWEATKAAAEAKRKEVGPGYGM